MKLKVYPFILYICMMGCGPEGTPLATQAHLGERLFFDPVLSLHQDRACASCHNPADSFGGPPQAPGEVSIPSLLDVSRQRRLGRANPMIAQLEDQTRIALFGEEPAEMGMSGATHQLMRRLRAAPYYCVQLLGGVFIHGNCVDGEHDARGASVRVIHALSAYQRTLTFPRTTLVDRWQRGERTLDDEASAGAALFYADAGCARCHGGDLYATSYTTEAEAEGGAPPDYVRVFPPRAVARPLRLGLGVQAMTSDERDYQRFKTPTLRGIAWRGYYFHDGMRVSLHDAIAFHAPHLQAYEHAQLARFIEGLSEPRVQP